MQQSCQAWAAKFWVLGDTGRWLTQCEGGEGQLPVSLTPAFPVADECPCRVRWPGLRILAVCKHLAAGDELGLLFG